MKEIEFRNDLKILEEIVTQEKYLTYIKGFDQDDYFN